MLVAAFRSLPLFIVSLLLNFGPVAADEKSKDDAEAAKLVAQLGSSVFRERESAETKLVALGPKAKPAVIAGTKNSDAEIARRCQALLKLIRIAEREQFVAGKLDWSTPFGRRFKDLVGDTTESRKLFGELMVDEHLAGLVEELKMEPAEVTKHYAAEVARVNANWTKAFEAFTGQPVSPDLSARIRKASETTVSVADVVGVLFLGSVQTADAKADPVEARSVFGANSIELAKGSLKVPYRKLFVAWLENRRDSTTVYLGLQESVFASIAEAVPFSRRVVADTKASDIAISTAMLVIGNLGTLDDLTLLAKFRDDSRPRSKYSGDTQLRELATAMSLVLRKQNLEDFGFRRMNWMVWWVGPDPAPLSDIAASLSDESRDDALKKSWEWLDKQPKPSSKK